MKRSGTRNHQFVKRIPADLRERMVGMTLEVPGGETTTRVIIGPATHAMRFSLPAAERGEVKVRTAAAIQYLERLFQSLRSTTPLTLINNQVVALSRVAYDAWSQDPESAEAVVGPLIDRALMQRGIASVDTASREALLLEFLRALSRGVAGQAQGNTRRLLPRSQRFAVSRVARCQCD